jgi:hypothetical protein
MSEEMRCDICGTTEGVECEILLKGDQVDRIYHLCPKHWIQVYRRTLDDFLEASEYKTNSYIKMAVDKLVGDAINSDKVDQYSDEDGMVDVTKLDPKEIRKLRPYASDPDDEDYEA